MAQSDPPATPSLEALLGRLRLPTGIALAALAAVYAWTVVGAPADAVQGGVQKILYVHVPLALCAYVGFFGAAIGGALYLWSGRDEFDRMGSSAAEVGVLFCTLMIITGPIWAKATWGKWWVWDPRLTLTLLLWFVFLAYLLLRSFSEGGSRAARFASVYAVFGILLIPLNYYVIEIFEGRGMHPENLKSDSLGKGMRMPFLFGVLAWLTAWVHLWVRRWEVESLRVRAAWLSQDAEGDSLS